MFSRVVAVNAGVLMGAAVVLAVSPATVSSDLTFTEAAVLAVGTLLVIGVNVVLLHRVFGPLERLSSVMRAVEPPVPGARIGLERAAAEVTDVASAYNDMLDRLERERQDSGRRALAAQEAERGRVARELHDEVGQTLTGVMLQLEGFSRQAPPELAQAIRQLQETAREGVERVRDIARGLRPPALDEFGLRASLAGLASGFSERTGLVVRHRFAPDVPELAPEHDLAFYRVAQESLTNAARHAAARSVELVLERRDGAVILRVRDDGCGIGAAAGRPGAGISGMRERALLVGGSLHVADADGGGTEVRFAMPLQ
ncbi:MAG: histidine kinase [Solirubrobacteraceae bacterium]